MLILVATIHLCVITQVSSGDLSRGSDPILVTEDNKIVSSDGRENDWFGQHVSISGDVAVVGAVDHGIPLEFGGAAYVYTFDGFGWRDEQKLTYSIPMVGDAFGGSVVIDGQFILVGTSFQGLNNAGAAYVFEKDHSGYWNETQRLVPSDPTAVFFSLAMDVHDIWLIASAVTDSTAGTTFVYRYDGKTWNEEQEVQRPGDDLTDAFGTSVAIGVDAVLVGAPRGTGLVPSSGLVYGYRYDGEGWRYEQSLCAPDAHSLQLFGESVSLSGDVAVIGARCDNHAVAFQSK